MTRSLKSNGYSTNLLTFCCWINAAYIINIIVLLLINIIVLLLLIVITIMHTDGRKNGQTDEQTDQPTDKEAERRTNGLTDERSWRLDCRVDRGGTSWWAERQAGRQAGRQTGRTRGYPGTSNACGKSGSWMYLYLYIITSQRRHLKTVHQDRLMTSSQSKEHVLHNVDIWKLCTRTDSWHRHRAKNMYFTTQTFVT